MRHFVNFGLLFSFLTLAVTGGLAFFRPFSIVSTRVHIMFGVATVVLASLHVASRVGYFKKQLKPKADRHQNISKPLLLGIVAGWGILLAGAITGWAPVGVLIEQGYESKHRSEIVRASPLAGFMDPATHQRIVVRSPNKDADVAISLSVGFSKHLDKLPSIAVWAETTTGAMIETLYLDPALAYSKAPVWGGLPTARHHILPLWRHRYTMVSGIDPTGEVDAFSGATATHSFSLDDYLVLGEEKSFVLCAEVNAPADINDTYSDPHVGQPSLLYTALIELDKPQAYTLLELTGHGGGAEKGGSIQYDLEGFTSANQLIDLLLVKAESISRKP